MISEELLLFSGAPPVVCTQWSPSLSGTSPPPCGSLDFVEDRERVVTPRLGHSEGPGTSGDKVLLLSRHYFQQLLQLRSPCIWEFLQKLLFPGP